MVSLGTLKRSSCTTKNQGRNRQGARMGKSILGSAELPPIVEPDDYKPKLDIGDKETKCPVLDGVLGTDYGMYLNCSTCKSMEECKKQHNENAKRYREEIPFKYIKIPVGVLTHEELKPAEALLLSIIIYRCQGASTHSWSYDKNRTFASLLKCSERWAGKMIGALEDKGFIWTQYQKLRRRQPDKDKSYRTSRKIHLTKKTVRLLNMTKLSKDGGFEQYSEV
jgi:hypothetical protein